MKPWKTFFQPHILERGVDYHKRGLVTELIKTDTGYQATVAGTEDYLVEIMMEQNAVQEMYCTCPYAEDGRNCKHMAAVLCAIDGQAECAAIGQDVCTLSPSELVEKIPEEELRFLLTELLSRDRKFYEKLSRRYVEIPLDIRVKTLRRKIETLPREYERYGEIDYRSAYPFAEDVSSFIDEELNELVQRNAPLEAFQLAFEAFSLYCSYEVDDSDGGTWLVESAMDELLKKILEESDITVRGKIFDELEAFTRSKESWLIEDFAEKAIYSNFTGTEEELLRKKLSFVDERIQKAKAEIERSGNTHRDYLLTEPLEMRVALMEELSVPKVEVNAFLAQYLHYTDIRLFQAERLEKAGDAKAAIQLLQEGKRTDDNFRYSSQLIRLYEQAGDIDALRLELTHLIFDLGCGRVEELHKLKACSTSQQWLEYRARYLAEHGDCAMKLMQEENLKEELLKAVIQRNSLYILDQYENNLRNYKPEAVRDAYAALIRQEGERASNRGRYMLLAQYLKKLKRYPNGKAVAAEIAADWRRRFARRHAMLEELKNAGL